MALKKSQLYRSLWASCDELRGGMDASQYKDYVLTLLFVKYVSDKAAADPDALIEVPEGGSFDALVLAKNKPDIGEQINVAIRRLAEANELQGVIDLADFDEDAKLGSGNDKVDRLTKLVGIFQDLDLRANRAEGDDLLGDAYEYLMRHFATESGKSKGQFYTPAEVSRIMAAVVGIRAAAKMDQPTVYDPTCGSGSLLIKAADAAGAPNLAIYGQENDNATWALARMNMVLHNRATANLWRENTLANPHFTEPDGSLKRFDFAVANPPFSTKSWTNGVTVDADPFGRFEHGAPPKKNGDYAFLLHILKSLKTTGRAAVILPHGVLFRGGREAAIRRRLVDRGLIAGVIGLPANLFFGTGIPACILVLDKGRAAADRPIFMLDASRGFAKDGPKNRLRPQDLHRIVDTFTAARDVPGYSRSVPHAELASPANDYNLNLPRYVDAAEPEDLHDLDAHLHGGIPERDVDGLARFWQTFPSLRAQLFAPDRPGYVRSTTPARDVAAAVLAHPEFAALVARVDAVMDAWQAAHEPRLRGLRVNDRPADVIDALGEDLLARFADVPLLDRYDAYGRLLAYWGETMQDDVYSVAADGWLEAAKPREPAKDKQGKLTETPDLVIGTGRTAKRYVMDLIPPALIVARSFASERDALDTVRAAADVAGAALAEFADEHAVDEGLLEEVISDKGTVARPAVVRRLREVGDDAEFADERAALSRWLELSDAETAASRVAKTAADALDRLTLHCYATLTENEIKQLAVADKWFASVRDAIDDELRAQVRLLVERIRLLDERYAAAMPAIECDIGKLGVSVQRHLASMGVRVG